jgi:hypothetical protein
MTTQGALGAVGFLDTHDINGTAELELNVAQNDIVETTGMFFVTNPAAWSFTITEGSATWLGVNGGNVSPLPTNNSTYTFVSLFRANAAGACKIRLDATDATYKFLLARVVGRAS